MSENQVSVKFYHSNKPFEFLLIPDESNLILQDEEDYLEIKYQLDGKSVDLYSLAYKQIKSIRISADCVRGRKPNKWSVWLTFLLSFILLMGSATKRLDSSAAMIYLLLIMLGLASAFLFPKSFRIIQIEFDSTVLQFACSSKSQIRRMEELKSRHPMAGKS